MKWFNSILLLSALAVGVVHANPAHKNILAARGSCGNNEWFYSGKSCCIPYGGPSKPPSPPAGTSCPSCEYDAPELHTILFIVPFSALLRQSENVRFYFFNSAYSQLTVRHSCCLPKQPNSGTPSCSGGYTWDSGKDICKKSTPAPPPTSPKGPSNPSCSKSEFWWDNKPCCLPNGGPSTPPSPPSGSPCPSSPYFLCVMPFI